MTTMNLYHKINWSNIYFIFTVSFVFLLALTSFIFYGYGADDSGYLMYWINTCPLQEYLFYGKEFEKRAIEITYSYLFAFFRIFTNDIEVFKFFNTFITLSIMAYAYYKVSKRYYLHMLIYTSIYLFIDFNIDQFRNALAASFGLLAIVQLSKKETYYSFFNFIIAALIHTSMLWLAVIYLTKNMKYNKIMIVLLIVLILIPNKVNLFIDLLNNNFFDIIDTLHLFGKIQYYALDSNSVSFQKSFFSFFMGKVILVFVLGYLIKMDKLYLDTYLYAILFIH